MEREQGQAEKAETKLEGQPPTLGGKSIVQVTTQFGLQLLQTVTHVLHATHLQHTVHAAQGMSCKHFVVMLNQSMAKQFYHNHEDCA